MPYFFGGVWLVFVLLQEKKREGKVLSWQKIFFLEQNFFYHFCGKWVHFWKTNVLFKDVFKKVVVSFIKDGCSKNKGTPKSSILIGFSINYPFWGYHHFRKHQKMASHWDAARQIAVRLCAEGEAKGLRWRGESIVMGPFPNIHVGVSKNRGTPKWMFYNGKPY